MSALGHIVFYDGDCGFCDTSIRQIMRIDGGKRIRFAPLQGETAKSLLPPELRSEANLKTLVYLDPQSRRFTKSEAIIEILKAVGGFWRIASFGRILPLSWRDALYDSVAERRRRLISKASCALPTQDQRSRILP